MNAFSLIATILIVGINALLALLTLYSNPTRSVNRRFVLWLLFLILWDASLFVFYNTYRSDTLLMLGRINFVSACLLATSALLFVSIFPENRDYLGKNIRGVAVIWTAFLTLVTLFTDLISVEETRIDASIETTYGLLYFIYVMHIVFFLLATLLVLLRKFFRTEPKYKNQLLRLFLTLSVAVAWGLLTNLLLPLFGIFQLQPFGPLGTILFSGFITYSIIRHQFLDIRLLVGRVVYYFFIAFLFFITYFVIYYFDNLVFGSSESTGAIIVGPGIAILFSILFVKFNDYIKTQVRTRLINPGFDPLEEIDKLSKKIAILLNINDISLTALNTLHQTLRTNYEAVIVFPEQGNNMLIETSSKKETINAKIFEDLVLIWEKIGNVPIIYDQFRDEIPDDYVKVEKVIKSYISIMDELQIRLIMPLKQEDKNVGIIILGQKEADNTYTLQEIEFVNSIASNIALAITRAMFYEEVQNFNKTLQQKIDQATSELQQKNFALADSLRKERDMMDVLGHELRTPLSVARNAILMIEMSFKRKEPEYEEIDGLLDKAKENLKREVILLETILSSTRIENKKLTVNFTRVDCNDVVHDTIDGYQNEAKKKGLELNSIVPENTVYCWAGREQTQEVLDNLVSNAIKYTLTGSVTIKLEEVNDVVRFSVIDTGIGIPEEEIPNLGKKFHRVDPYLQSGQQNNVNIVRPGGTGIGLYVVIGLLKLMKGTLQIKSKLNEGSTFIFTLPKYLPQDKQEAIPQSSTQVPTVPPPIEVKLNTKL